MRSVAAPSFATGRAFLCCWVYFLVSESLARGSGDMGFLFGALGAPPCASIVCAGTPRLAGVVA